MKYDQLTEMLNEKKEKLLEKELINDEINEIAEKLRKKALKTLVPNSCESIYLQFCEEYKKCCREKKLSPELNKIIEKAKSNRINNKLIQVLETKRDLLEYDLPQTSKEKKKKAKKKL